MRPVILLSRITSILVSSLVLFNPLAVYKGPSSAQYGVLLTRMALDAKGLRGLLGSRS